MNDLERFNATMNYANPDRAPFKEFLWPTWGLIPLHIDTGVDILSPFEVQAGMHVLAVRKKYGRGLRIWGGVDKRPLAEGPAAIDSELRRIEPLIRDGRHIPMLDHSATPDIPYRNYCYFLEKLRQIL